MKIDISKLIDKKSNAINVTEKIFLKEIHRGNEVIHTDGLTLEGKIVNVNEEIVFSGALTGNFKTQCSRCLEDVHENIAIKFNEIIYSKDNDDSIMVFEEKSIDTEIFAEGLFLLKLDMIFLCKTDCKGLCGQCGINLNEKECDCEKDDLDIRLMELKKFIIVE
ncbi:MAG: DUF177 domain-containing protein [Peptostreptococcales bacterium]